jgi:hypothetical protein
MQLKKSEIIDFLYKNLLINTIYLIKLINLTKKGILKIIKKTFLYLKQLIKLIKISNQ